MYYIVLINFNHLLIIIIINVQPDVLMGLLHPISQNNVYLNVLLYLKIHLPRTNPIFVWSDVHYLHMEVHKIYIVSQIVGGLTIKIKYHKNAYKYVQMVITDRIKRHNVLKNVLLIHMLIQQQKDVLHNAH